MLMSMLMYWWYKVIITITLHYHWLPSYGTRGLLLFWSSEVKGREREGGRGRERERKRERRGRERERERERRERERERIDENQIKSRREREEGEWIT